GRGARRRVRRAQRFPARVTGAGRGVRGRRRPVHPAAPGQRAVESEAAVKLSCVILTMGNRPAELRRAIDSVRAQRGEPIELVVVGNGADVPDLDPDVTYLRLPENVGLPEGRNRGAEAATGEVVLFLDDAGWYP